MNTSTHTKRNTTNQMQLCLLLLLFTTSIFPMGAMGQTPQGLTGFNCYFSNADGPIVYPCASIVTAHIEIPSALTEVTITFPNSFQITNVVNGTPSVINVSPNPVTSGFSGFGTTAIPGDLMTQTFVPSNANMQIEFTYRSCIAYPNSVSTQLNTNALLFDCDGKIGSIEYLAYLDLPPVGTPGLNLVYSDVMAQANYPTPSSLNSLNLVGGINQTFFGNNFTPAIIYERFFTVEINSEAITEFDLIIADETDVNEEGLFYFNNGVSSAAITPTIPFPFNASATGTFHVNTNTIPVVYLIDPPIGPRTITFRQTFTLNCNTDINAAVSVILDCDACNIAGNGIMTCNPIKLDGHIADVTDIKFTSSTLQNHTSNAPTDPCDGIYYFDLAFEYNNTILTNISRLDVITIPINTENFNVQSIAIGDGNSFSNFYTTVQYPNDVNVFPLNNPNSILSINLYNLIIANSNATWPGIDIDFNGYQNGAWINSIQGTTNLIVRLKLQSNFYYESSCPDAPLRLTPLANNQITFSMNKTCPSSSLVTDNVNPSIVATPPMPVLQPPTLIVNPDVASGSPNPLWFSCEVSIPTQSPFDIDATGPLTNFQVNQITCSDITYRAIISGISTPNTQGSAYLGSISSVSITINGTNFQITNPSTINNTITIDLPTVPFVNQISNQYEILFGVVGIGCPDPIPVGSGQGNIQYTITIQAVCNDCEIPPTPSNSIKNITCTSTNVSIHCDGLCTSAVGTNDDLTIKRITFGWTSPTDYLNNFPPIADETEFINFCTTQIQPPVPDAIIQTQLRRLYPFDLFQINVTGSIKPAVGQTHNNLSFEINYPQASQLGDNFYNLFDFMITFTEADAFLNPIGTPIPISLNDNIHAFSSVANDITIPEQPMAGAQWRKDLIWTATQLNSFNSDIDINSHNYLITLSCTLRVTATTPIGPSPCSLQCLFKTTNTGSPAFYRSCDIRGDGVNVLIPNVEFSQNSVQTGNINLPPPPAISNNTVGNVPSLPFCEFGHAIGIRHSGGNGNFVDFGPEFRPLTAWPSLLNATGINTISGFPGINNFSYNNPNYQNQTISQLLPPLERNDIGNTWQGLVITMDKDCPNSNPTVNLNLDIQRNAYVHSGFGLTSPTINPPPITPNFQVSGLSCNLITFNDALNPIIIPNNISTYPFAIDVPPEFVGIPFAIEIGTDPVSGVQLNATFTTAPSNVVNNGTNTNWYVFNNGLQANENATLHIILPGTNGCYAPPFNVTFKLHVACKTSDLPSANNLNPTSCFTCTRSRTFKMGTNNNVTLNNSFSTEGCNIKWTLELTNPLTEPDITFSELNLNLSTGLIYQNLAISISGVGLTPLPQLIFNLNQPASPSVSGVNTTIALN